MSFHITSGTLGQAMAPLVFAPVAQHFGLSMVPWLMVPGLLIVGLVLLPRLPRIDRLQDHHDSAGGFRALLPYAKPLTLLYLIVVLRTMTAATFSTFTPVMLVRRGMSVAQAGTIAAIYLTAVGAGGFFGGPLADRFGPRRVIVLSLCPQCRSCSRRRCCPAPPLLPWSPWADSCCSRRCRSTSLSARSLAPISAATVSSLMMGFAWGMSGLSVPFTGMLGDRIGIERTMMAMACVPLFAAALAWPLPGGKRTHTPPVLRNRSYRKSRVQMLLSSPN